MDSSPSSPERPPVKVTYLERPKGRRSVPDTTGDPETDFTGNQREAGASHKPLFKAPEGKMKKIDFRDIKLPGPSPKRVRRDSEEPEGPKSVQANNHTHKRSSSSTTSLNRVIQQVAASPSTNKKRSALGSENAKSLSRASVASLAAEDNISVTDSLADSVAESIRGTTRIRRTEAERRQYFENQPECANISPYEVTCTRCDKVLKLDRRRPYHVQRWEKHRLTCDLKPLRNSNEAGPSKGGISDSLSEITTGSPVEQVPSSRVAAAERKLRLVNDPQAKSYQAHDVECAVCGVRVNLKGDGQYNLTSWEEHKDRCKYSPLPGTENVIPFPIKSTEPSPSTLVDAAFRATGRESSPSNLHGVKRPREEPALVPDEDLRPHNRPRHDTYAPPQEEAPTAMGWFLLPVKAFIRGFRESLKGDSS